MKYSAGLPDEHVNLPRQPVWLQAVKLSVSLALLAAVGFVLLTLAVNGAVAYVTPEQEKVLMQSISSETNLKGDQNGSLDAVTAKLVACTSLPYEVRSYVVEADEPNAFALPGGVVYVTSGLMKNIGSENELAFVIGHELGHFKHKDHLRRFGYSLLLAVISMLIGEDSSMAFHTVLNIGSATYSRSAEREADLYGLEAMQCAYGSVTDATAFFERMAKKGKWQGFLASHPAFEDRIASMRDRIKAEGMDTGKKALPLQAE